MRTTPLALAFVLVACGRSERASAPAASNAPIASTMRGPDQLALRFPRAGGQVRAYAYPELDSTLWTSGQKAPPIARVLGFDDEAGSVAAVDNKGGVVRIDLRLSTITRDTKPKLTDLASIDGSAVYGIDDDGSVVRLTPSASWTFKPPSPARDLIPEPDGSLLILGDHDGGTAIWQMYPPDRTITDTAFFPRVTHVSRTQVGDRVYFTVDSGLVGLQSRGLVPVPSIRFRHRVRALTTTPSGDRIYVAVDSTDTVTVIDRYTHKIETHIATPGQATELRMDPMGRFVLARPSKGDSAWVITVGTDHLVGSVETEWRTDLPVVAPNGWMALLRGHDVVFLDGQLARQKLVKGGGRDAWLFVGWNGFRPRPKGLDEPVTFGEDTVPADTADTTNAFADQTPVPDTAPPPAAPETPVTAAAPHRSDSVSGGPAARGPGGAASAAGFTVQFAALRSEDAARTMAREITVQGAPPRVVTTMRAGIPVYRVVIGPFATRADADRVARTSGKSYWIYEGAP